MSKNTWEQTINSIFDEFGEIFVDGDGFYKNRKLTKPFSKEFTMKLNLAGCRKENIEVTFNDSGFSVSAQQKKSNKEDEIITGDSIIESYSRKYALDTTIYDLSKTVVTYVDGVLSLSFKLADKKTVKSNKLNIL